MEADERILFHTNHAIQTEHYTRIAAAATNTDIFISLLYHYQQWVYADLNEMWVFYGQGLSTRATTKISDALESDVISVLPAVHALSGCDSTSKIGGKTAALKVSPNLVNSLYQNCKSQMQNIFCEVLQSKNKGYDF